jgi:hypothetical protein
MDTDIGWRISVHSPITKLESIEETHNTFMDYLLCQEEHIKQCYTHIEFHAVPHRIYELFKSTHKVNIATDGGAVPLKGSIGFVFAEEDGTILLT